MMTLDDICASDGGPRYEIIHLVEDAEEGSEYYYRAECHYFIEEYTAIYVFPCKITRLTPKGLYVMDVNNPSRERLIIKSHKKKYAYPTRELALNSLKYRTIYYRSILKARLKKCEAVLNCLDYNGYKVEWPYDQ